MKPLSETAADRLETIAVNNDLGSGMQVALKDLELRGAGNLLGAEQAGHIAGVGFDLYLRMIGEAVATFRGDEVDGPTELRLELPIDARLPESYIDSERLRLEAYQKLSAAASPDARTRRRCRVLHRPDRPRDRGAHDRYGTPPREVDGLVAIARLRRRAAVAGLSDVVAMGPNLRVVPAPASDSLRVRLQRLYPKSKVLAGARRWSFRCRPRRGAARRRRSHRLGRSAHRPALPAPGRGGRRSLSAPAIRRWPALRR
jgi:transcription-repair coupling factor (superfamily II helicase)